MVEDMANVTKCSEATTALLGQHKGPGCQCGEAETRARSQSDIGIKH